MREISLLPGKSLATLTLSDGSSRVLSLENFDLIDGSKRIVNDPDGLSYQVEDTSICGEIAYNEITVPRGGEYKVTLDDGTRIWLNSESYIRFPVVFQGDERRIWVSGEVFLEVSKDAERPFIVNTEKLNIKVLGRNLMLGLIRTKNVFRQRLWRAVCRWITCGGKWRCCFLLNNWYMMLWMGIMRFVRLIPNCMSLGKMGYTCLFLNGWRILCR